MKKVFIPIVSMLISFSAFACDPIGWRLVKQGQLSALETVCTYEKNGYTTNIVVKASFCPLNPCSRY